jgi:hypothetical protein
MSAGSRVYASGYWPIATRRVRSPATQPGSALAGPGAAKPSGAGRVAGCRPASSPPGGQGRFIVGLPVGGVLASAPATASYTLSYSGSR